MGLNQCTADTRPQWLWQVTLLFLVGKGDACSVDATSDSCPLFSKKFVSEWPPALCAYLTQSDEGLRRPGPVNICS